MRQDLPLLDNVRVAAPCPANWNEMAGGEHVRYCRACEKNVYNISEMSRTDAEELLETHEGRLCIRYYQRADGKIITQNCPVGLRGLRRAYFKTSLKVSAWFTAAFGLSAFFFLPVFAVAGARESPRWREHEIERREKEIVELKNQLSDKSKHLTTEQREDLQASIDYLREQQKSGLVNLQKEAAEK